MGMKEIITIAKIHTDFPDKFGIPRQSVLGGALKGRIVFEKKYGVKEAFLGIEEYSHLWLLWGFSKAEREGFTPSVHPPRLGGKEKRGVFATRSPFRPNPIALSVVKLEQVIWEGEDGVELLVSGIDMLDGSPVYDVKPYLPYEDSVPEAIGSFGQQKKDLSIDVVFPKELLDRVPAAKQDALLSVLRQDPRAAYQKAPDYVYGMAFGGQDIRFTVQDDTLQVVDVVCGDAEKIK